MKEATGLIIGLQEQRKEIYRATWFCRICEMASRRRRRGTGGQQRRYKFPYGDFNNVHRCAVLAAEARAGRYKHADIELAAAHLHGMLEELMAMQHREAKGHGHVSPY